MKAFSCFSNQSDLPGRRADAYELERLEMSAPLNPRQIFLLERYSSLAYYTEMRDAFARMLDAAEEALREFMRHLPSDYRNWPTWEQPDRSWGEVVLPNLRWTMQAVDDGLVQMQNGELEGMGMAGNVQTAFAGMSRDYTYEWMPEPWKSLFDSHNTIAWHNASNISFTEQASWEAFGLTSDEPRSLQARGAVNPPPSWPQYRLNPSIRIRTDEIVPRSGIYLPDADLASAQVLIQGREAHRVRVSESADEDANSTRQPTTWTLVERIADSGGGIPGAADPIAAGIRLRVMQGNTCPRTGFWFTPANQNSRRRFAAGEVMPDLNSPYGATIWQWDGDS